MASPLADRLRPKTLDQVVGQRHILGENGALLRVVQSGAVPNMIFYGPSGVGKTTVARIIAENAGKKLHKLNGTTASLADIRAVMDDLDTISGYGGVVLYLDEIQYLNKKQQQSLLEYIEDGRITLIASTTENPYFYIYNAILSRCTVFEFKQVPPEEVERAVQRGFSVLSDELGSEIRLEDGVLSHIALACGGDVRKALNTVELLALSSDKQEDGSRLVPLSRAKELAQRSAMRYDRDGDEHYDILSAFQKSMRGSDPDAAIHYLARLLEAGDLISACRRLMVCACEDVGLAYPQIIPIVKAACDIAMQVGLPEARIPLADAVILVATSPKSNTGEAAVDAAMADLKAGRSGPIPRNLQNKHYDGAGVENPGQHYLYPHDYPGRWVPQQYLPDALQGQVYYHPADNKNERAAAEYWKKIKGQS
ncbi:MAG: replication-associated recombination protein A [Oscillospiraceae bacterium]|nr:replication-associated recombination protein A [Oscillospiraceae bacterium]